MLKAARISSLFACILLPVALYFVWPKWSLVGSIAVAFVSLLLSLSSFKWPEKDWLRWLAFLPSLAITCTMLGAFSYMLFHVSAPPSVLSTLPLIIVALVLLLTPLLNTIALLLPLPSARLPTQA